MSRDAESAHRFDARHAATLALVALLYFVAARFGLSLAFTTKQVTALWPPTGIALAALLLRGMRLWPAIAVAAFLVNASVGDSLLLAAATSVGNTLGPVLAALCLRRLAGFEPTLARVRDVVSLFVIGAALGMTVTATCGTACLAAGGVIPWSNWAWRTAWPRKFSISTSARSTSRASTSAPWRDSR